MDSFKKFIAEFIGTCVLVVFGCGTAMTVGCDASSGCGYILTALAFGLVIVAMAYSVGNISGCHINPAVSIGMLVSGRMSFKDFIGYVISQFLGATAGALILNGIFSYADLTDKTGAIGSNALANDSVIASLIIEVILTFVFVFAILGVTSKIENSSVAGVVIGLTLTLVHILGIGLTGTSVNPARSFGPALIAGGDSLSCVWVFIVAPLIGGVLAALVYKLISLKNKD
ncbi:MAG: MIP family channel protein [Clostridia bacterium]|nr:MIP family channel protein [Clostridia bacterium]